MCEDSPDNKARKSPMGRMLDTRRNLATKLGKMQFVFLPDWPRSSVYVEASEDRRVTVARVSASGQPMVDVDGCVEIFGVPGTDLERAYTAARRA